MSVQSMEPMNSRRARDTSIKAFNKFLEQEGTNLSELDASLQRNETGDILVELMDLFGSYLVFRPKPLSKNTVLSYFRHVKLWLFEKHPQLELVTSQKLLKMARTIDHYCVKRKDGDYVKKAIACTHENLDSIMHALCLNAKSSACYQDAALVCLLWHLFGRASDISLLNKQNIGITEPNVVFCRLVRMKTGYEQSLSLIPSENFKTCPVIALGVALLMSETPSVALFDHLPKLLQEEGQSSKPKRRLQDYLHGKASSKHNVDAERTGVSKSPGIHAYINRLLQRIGESCPSACGLTSHSFRRGGAQCANGSAEISPQWICDRGAWNMTSTNKAFAYIFNTTKEDQRVAKVLSGYAPHESVPIVNMSYFDAQSRQMLKMVQQKWFISCSGLALQQYNVLDEVLDLLTVYLIKAYLDLKALKEDSPIIMAMDQGARLAGMSPEILVVWSSMLRTQNKVTESVERRSDASDMLTTQTLLIQELVSQNKRLIEKLDELTGRSSPKLSTMSKLNIPTLVTKSRAKKSTLAAVWFSWYTTEPRIWLSRDPSTRHKRSESKLVVAFMRLFIDLGYRLDETSHDYKDIVLALGEEASANMLNYLTSIGSNVKSPGSCLKELRRLLVSGALNDRIEKLSNFIVSVISWIQLH